MKTDKPALVITSGLSRAQISDVTPFLATIFQSNLFSHDYLDWLYNKSPYGTAICITAYHKDQVVGHMAGLPREYDELGTTTHRGLLAVNTAVDKSFLKFGVFNNLIQTLKDEMKTKDFDFILGIPNGNAVNGWLKRGKADYIGKLNLHFTLCLPPLPASKVLKFTKQNEMMVWMSNDPSHKRIVKQKTLLSKFKFLPLWFFAIVSYCAEEKPASLFGSSVLFGYIGSRRPKGLTLKLPDFLKPSPLHIILITERREIVSFFKQSEIQAKDFDAL